MQGGRRFQVGKSAWIAERRCRRGLRTPPRAVEPTAEKSLAGQFFLRPYRKRTHVGEARSLRCSSDPRRRNSAKCPRNFGRRGACGRWTAMRSELKQAAENRPKRLFIKNTGACEVVEEDV